MAQGQQAAAGRPGVRVRQHTPAPEPAALSAPGGADAPGVWVFDRERGELELEPIVAPRALRWLYGGGWLGRAARALLRRRAVSRLWGWLQDRPVSRRRLARFIARAGVELSEAELPLERYRTLNEFFSRRLRPGARPLDPDPDALLSPADARVLVCSPLDAEARLCVKGESWQLAELLGERALARQFAGGTAVVLRLAPADYHRFHFPADGVAGPARALPGGYDSVHPLALAREPAVLCRNARQLTLLRTPRFGTIAMVEVGALLVGSIVQTYTPGPVERGAEKGYFRFGGSSIVLALEPGRLVLEDDLVQHSARGLETKLRMGTRLGRCAPPGASRPRAGEGMAAADEEDGAACRGGCAG
ncbi:MAG: phosphatidylserine decarboxylase proenzyme [Planctomycetota bacterium]|nr:MAG: phosphatidylserine decarboxylase proenzyme [Planctomycetota bacterium]